ncbi:MAG: cyclic nucleotide-binding domain-containing protein [Anaerolineae bacterium]
MRSYFEDQVSRSDRGEYGSLSPLVGVLRQVDLFHNIPRRNLVQIAEACREQVYELGEMIMEENTAGRDLFVITDGAVEILIDPRLLGLDSSQAQPVVIATLWPGQTFGEIGLVDQGMRSASARAAAEETRLQALNRAYLLQLCEEDHRFGYRLMRNIAGDLAFKIRNTDLMLRQRILWEYHPDEVENPFE